MTTVLIFGDSHADGNFIRNILTEARSFNVTDVVQLGDFGYSLDSTMLAPIRAWLDEDEGRTFYWLDGNHDEHNYINDKIVQGNGYDKPIAHFHDRMMYCPRGSTAQIGSKLCMFLGGAYSIDKYHRTPHVSWWPQEMITDEEVERACSFLNEQDYVDVMFCHDTPPTEWIEQQLASIGYKSDPNSHHNRVQVGRVVNAVLPAHLYHGHFHWRYDTLYTTPDGWVTQVHGIGANVSEVGWKLDPTAHFGHNFVIENW